MTALLLLIGAGWLAFGLVGTLVLYIGYGFVMAAQSARKQGLSQRYVVAVDVLIALPFVALDALLNVLVFSVLMLDFRGGYTLVLTTRRFSRYSLDPAERGFRKATANLFAAFLDGKDPSGDHISGPNKHFGWLD